MLAKLNKLKKLLNVDETYPGIVGLTDDIGNNDLQTEIVNDINLLTIQIDEDKKDIKKQVINNLTIQPIIKEEQDYMEINEFLPRIPFSLLNCGTRGAGKSVLTLNMLEWYKDYFDKIFIFSPTIELDYKYKITLEKLDIEYKVGTNIFFDYEEEVFRNILNKIKVFNKDKPFSEKAKILMIFDDIITLLPKNKKKTIFNRLILNNRHYNISTIINSQSFKLLDSNFRKVASQIVLFKTDNTLELDNYIKELSGMLGGGTLAESRRRFFRAFRFATSEPHSFLFINYHHPNVLFKNFDEAIDLEALKYEDEIELEEKRIKNIKNDNVETN